MTLARVMLNAGVGVGILGIWDRRVRRIDNMIGDEGICLSGSLGIRERKIAR
jgi:hypothetical protein